MTPLEDAIVNITAERWREHGLAGNWGTAEDNNVWNLDESHYINGIYGVIDRDFSLHFCLHIGRRDGQVTRTNWAIIHVYSLLTIYDVQVEWLRDEWIPFGEDRVVRSIGHWFVDRVDAYEDAGPPEQCQVCLRAVSGCVCHD